MSHESSQPGGDPVNANVERARAVWRNCGMRRGIHYPEFCAALRRSPWALDLRVVLVPMETLISPRDGTVYGCIYADTAERFITLVRDDLPLEHQDLVVYHEADHAISGDVVPAVTGNWRDELFLQVQWREDSMVTPQEVDADEFARELYRLTMFGDDASDLATVGQAVVGDIAHGRIQAFHDWIRRRR